jgi:phosphonate transport system substrate-binding protein
VKSVVVRRSGLSAVLVCLCLFGSGFAAAADWRNDLKVLRVGVVAGSDAAYRVQSLDPFRAYLQRKLDLPVEIVPLPSIEALIDAQSSARVQYAIDSAAAFAATAVSCRCVEPLVMPTAENGAKGFYSVLLARADSPIKSLADAKGARLALAPSDSVAGNLVPRKAFEREGIEPDSYFASVELDEDPGAAIASLLAGTADVAAGWTSLTGDQASGYDFGVLARMVSAGKLSMDQVRIVWQSQLIPFGPHVVLTSLQDEPKRILRDAMLSIGTDDPEASDALDRLSEGGGGFVAADLAAYDVVKSLVADLRDDRKQ